MNMVTAITNDLLRSSIQLVYSYQHGYSKVDVGSIEGHEERKRCMPLKSITHLIFSFKGLRQINHLDGLEFLTKLQLDNNDLSKIENLSHLKNLTLLDLSFNKIQKIEGLESLVKLDDISLYCNQIRHIEGLDALCNLTSLSLGKNFLQSLDEVLYLRRLKNLHLLTLDGNPFCKEQDYRTYVIGHLRDLRFLDHRIVDEESMMAAAEQYQDEMLELKQKEEDELLITKAALAKASHQQSFQEANLLIVDTLFDSMFYEDAEFFKIKEVPGLLESLDEYRQKSESNKEELIELILEQHGKKKEELDTWQSAIKMLLDKRDMESHAIIDSFKKSKKKIFVAVAHDPESGDAKLETLRLQNEKMKEILLEREMLSVGEIQDLWSKFDDNYAVLVENCKQCFQN